VWGGNEELVVVGTPKNIRMFGRDCQETLADDSSETVPNYSICLIRLKWKN
jgi:hypothetical protein